MPPSSLRQSRFSRNILRLQHYFSTACLVLLAAMIATATTSALHHHHPSILQPVLAFEPALALPSSARSVSRPSYIDVKDVSQKYPVTLMNKLFSSVPKREYALRNVNLSFGHRNGATTTTTKTTTPSSPSSMQQPNASTSDDDNGVILLVGRSASGKSTMLRLLAGLERPAEGFVDINGRAATLPGANGVGEIRDLPSWAKMSGGSSTSSSGARPVILSGKPDFDDDLAVMDRIVQMGLDTARRFFDRDDGCEAAEKELANDALLRPIARDYASLATLSDEQCNLVPSKLSPSEEYLFGIACGCMMSVAPSLVALAADQNAKLEDDSTITGQITGSVHSPILLFDELFDAEHPSTVQKCSEGILNLVQRAGGVVISATHRPRFFKGMAVRTVTLSGGKVLMDERII